jgi:hypothetical protein
MDNSPEQTQSAASKKDVLDAIDNEIAHRESVLSRHGISTWGIIAAICALIWAVATESLSATHNLTNVLLILLAGHVALGLLSAPWMKALGIGNLKGLSGQTLKELALRAGLEPDTVPYSVAQSLVLIAIGAYVGFKGFVLLSVTTCAVYCVVLLFIGFCWIAFHLQVPLKLPQLSSKKQGQLRAAVLTRLLIVLLILVPFDAVLSVWPVSVADARLGVMLAALVSLWGMSILLLKPPTATAGLREIRSCLAFGEIEPDEARTKAQLILRGTPEEHYVTNKADEAACEFREYIRLCDLVANQTEQVIQLADRLHANNGDESVLKEIAAGYRELHHAMLAELRDMDKHMAAGLKLRSQLVTRMKVAQIWLSVSSETLKTVLKHVDDIGKETTTARQRFIDLNGRFRPALDCLYTAQKDVKLPRKLTLSEAYDACFRT